MNARKDQCFNNSPLLSVKWGTVLLSPSRRIPIQLMTNAMSMSPLTIYLQSFFVLRYPQGLWNCLKCILIQDTLRTCAIKNEKEKSEMLNRLIWYSSIQSNQWLLTLFLYFRIPGLRWSSPSLAAGRTRPWFLLWGTKLIGLDSGESTLCMGGRDQYFGWFHPIMLIR